MTLNDIIVSALAQLDRGHDPQTIDAWRDKLTGFANDAVADLARRVKPRKTERTELTDGGFDISDLTENCFRIISVKKGAKTLAVTAEGGRVNILPERPADGVGEVEVSYLYYPRELSNPTDVPDLPNACHGLIVTYVVGRERASGDVSLQRGGSIYFQLYEAGKRALKPLLGLPGDQRIVNRW